jgi:hypothetical protein
MGRRLHRISDAEITCRGSAILAHAIITNNLMESTRALSLKTEIHDVDSQDIDYAIRNFERFLAEQSALLSKSKGGR